jgi:hypothetical protein
VESVRAVDLAVFADVLAGRAAGIAARLEQQRARIRQAAIERAVRTAFDAGTVARLEGLGVIGAAEPRALRAEAARLEADLAALELLQAWVEARLFEARDERAA